MRAPYDSTSSSLQTRRISALSWISSLLTVRVTLPWEAFTSSSPSWDRINDLPISTRSSFSTWNQIPSKRICVFKRVGMSGSTGQGSNNKNISTFNRAIAATTFQTSGNASSKSHRTRREAEKDGGTDTHRHHGYKQHVISESWTSRNSCCGILKCSHSHSWIRGR